MTTVDLSISALALEDHISRLYDLIDTEQYGHVDVEGAEITITARSGQAVRVRLTLPALDEFIDDLDYQIEFNEGSYRAQCRRALRKLQTAKAAVGNSR